MNDGRVTIDRDGPVAILTLDRPARKNALGGNMREELLSHLQVIGGDKAIGAIVLTGSGEAFCAGADVQDLAALHHAPDGAKRLAARLDVATEVVLALAADLAQPTLAAIRGPAVGAGLGLALACDYILAADDTVLMTGFAKLGLAADWGTSFTLPARVGGARALDMVLRSPRVGAMEALAAGLVDEVVPVDRHDQRWRDKARQWAEAPRGVREGALAVRRADRAALAAALEAEKARQLACFDSPEARERIGAFLKRDA